MKKNRVEPRLKSLALRDEVAEHCEHIAVIAGLLACGPNRTATVVDPELSARAGSFILNEVRTVNESLQKLYKHLPKSKS